MSARDEVNLAVESKVLRYEAKFLENEWFEILFTSYEVLVKSPGWEVRIIHEDNTESGYQKTAKAQFPQFEEA